MTRNRLLWVSLAMALQLPCTAVAQDAEPRTAIVLQVADSGLGVDIDTLAMRVDGNTVQPAISGAPDAFTVTCARFV